MNLCGLVGGLLLVAAAVPAQTFRAAANAVEVDVFVGRRGQPVIGLRLENFEVSDNGAIQELGKLDTGTIPLNVLIVLDHSESVRGAKLSDLKSAVSSLVGGLDPDDTVSLITFSNTVALTQQRGGDRQPIIDALSQVQGSGHTATNDGLFVALRKSQELDHPMVILFTDGRERFSWLSEDQAYETAKESEATIFVVSTEPESSILRAQTAFYRELCDMTGGEFYQARQSRELAKIFGQILQKLKHRYVLTYFPKGEVEEGWHELHVEVNGIRAEVRARRGYFYAR